MSNRRSANLGAYKSAPTNRVPAPLPKTHKTATPEHLRVKRAARLPKAKIGPAGHTGFTPTN